ncbi:MAG TPA: gamma-glutamyltransferase, partial [Polyangiaceae bacterium]
MTARRFRLFAMDVVRSPAPPYVRGSLVLALALFTCSRRTEPIAAGPAASALAAAPARQSMPAGVPTPPAPSAPIPAPIPPAALPPPLSPPVDAPGSRRGVVVAVEPLAAEAGTRILERGGNAIDAAIATTLALCVTHSSAASLGGGGFALVRRGTAPTEAFDFREVAPRALTRERFDRMIADGARGAAAVGVPGTVAGLAMLHARFGTRPFVELVEPALVLARAGHRLRPWQGRVLGWSYRALARDAAARAVFGRAGKPLPPSALLVQRDLAASLERLASAGPEDFYRGELARRLTAGIGAGGPSLDDLAAYRAVARNPLSFSYRGYTIETMPPPSAGGVALTGILLGLSRALPQGSPAGSADAVHWFLEASRRAQAERRLAIVDPDTLSPAELEARRARWLDPDYWLTVPI